MEIFSAWQRWWCGGSAEGSAGRQCTLAVSPWTRAWPCLWLLSRRAGACCRVKLGAGFLEEHALPQRLESEGVPSPPPPPTPAPQLSASATSFQFLFWVLSSGAGRGGACRHSRGLLPLPSCSFKEEKKTSTPICSEKPQQM